jgi:hypothetical protein
MKSKRLDYSTPTWLEAIAKPERMHPWLRLKGMGFGKGISLGTLPRPMADKTPLRISVKLEGPLVENHRLPLSEFTRITRQLRVSLRDVAMVLTEYGPSGRSGSVPKFIEEATDLRVVGSPRKGSFEIEFEVPTAAAQKSAQEALEFDVPALAERTVEAFVEGLEVLHDELEELPPGFDRGVLQAVTPFRTSMRRGVRTISLSTTNGKKKGGTQTQLDADKVKVIERLIKKPIRAHAAATGLLQMVDFSRLEFRIDRPGLPSIKCFFDERDRDRVQGAVRQVVHVSGEGEFAPEEREPSKISVASFDVLYEELPFDPAAFWKEREDITAAPSVPTFRLPRGLDDDPWRNDEEAAELIAAIEGDEV